MTSTGAYAWSLSVTVNYTGGPATDNASGTAYAIVNSALAAGWSISGVDQLVSVTGGMLYVYGSGGFRLFTGSGPSYTSPANDFGTLVKNVDNSYTYTATDQTKFNFSSGGALASVVDTHNQAVTYTYSSGVLSQVDTPDGGTSSISYDSFAGAWVITEPGSRVFSVNMGASNTVASISQPDSKTRTFSRSGSFLASDNWSPQLATFTYDSTTGLLSSINRGSGTTLNLAPAAAYGLATSPAKGATPVGVVTDALSHLTSFSLDSQGRTTKLQTPDGGVTTYALDSAGHVTVLTDAMSRVTTFTYAANTDDMTQVTYPDGSNEQFTYDSTFHQVTKHVDTLGNTTTYTIDGTYGDLTKIQNAKNEVTTLVWSSGLLQSKTDALNHITSFSYDGSRRLSAIQDPLTHRTTFTYSAAGNVNTVKDALSHVTTSTLDAMNRLIGTVDAAGGVATMTYNADGQIATQFDPLGREADYTYDTRGWNTVYQSGNDSGAAGTPPPQGDGDPPPPAFASTVTSTYDVLGREILHLDGNANATTMNYDAMGHMLTIKSPVGGVTSYTYDLNGEQLTAIDPLSRATTFTYDNRGRQSTVTEPGGGVVTMAYDTQGNKTSVKDELGKTTTYSYDALNRLIKTTDANNGVTTQTFDAVGNQVTLVDPDSNTTTFSYNAANLLIQKTDPLNHATSYAYDAANRLTSTTDGAGQRKEMTYDAAGRVTGVVWKSAGGSTVNTQTFTYDLAGNELTASDQNGAYTYTYDSLDRVTVEKEPFGVVLTNTYDAVGNRTKREDSFSGVTTFVYDQANRLTSEQFGGSGQTPLRIDMAYDLANQVTTITRFSDLAGTTKIGSTLDSYDSAGRLQNQRDRNSSDANIANYTYTYDLANRVTTEKLNGANPVTYTYDNVGQLTNDGTTTYTYDANGNRTMAGYATGTGNQLTSQGAWSYNYDANGNLTSKSQGPSLDTWTYGYDVNNRLVTVQDRATSGGTLLSAVTYVYDVQGNRVEEDTWSSGSGSTTIRFAYDGQNAFADLNGSNALVTRRLYLNGIDSLFARVSAGGTAAWYLTDRLGSVRGMVDAGGTPQATVAYDGFGNVTSNSNGSFTDRYLYTGRELDSATGLQYNRARYYDPVTGRWTQQDPLGFGADDANLYRYVSNDTTNNEDPTGQWRLGIKFWFPISGIIGGSIEVSVGTGGVGASGSATIGTPWPGGLIWIGPGTKPPPGVGGTISGGISSPTSPVGPIPPLIGAGGWVSQGGTITQGPAAPPPPGTGTWGGGLLIGMPAFHMDVFAFNI